MSEAQNIDNITDAPKQELTLMGSLEKVLKNASNANGLLKGVKETIRGIEKRKAFFVVLADNVDKPKYKKIVSALCDEAKIDVIQVPDRSKLGEWSGLVKFDKNMKPRKVVKCGCVAVTDFGEDSPELNFILAHFDKEAKPEEESK